MTEEEWLRGENTLEMLEFVRGAAGEPKWWLIAVECLRKSQERLADKRSRDAIAALECLAEGKPFDSKTLHYMEGEGFLVVYDGTYTAGFLVDVSHAENTAVASIEMATDIKAKELGIGGYLSYLSAFAPLLRDIFGNPFRPVSFDPAWRTEHTVGMALKMYEDRDFTPMPILADALQDAGCTNDDILNHCREAGNHVRGCWVVDLLLGKE